MPPGGATIEHYHRTSEEIYLFTQGHGSHARLGEDEVPARAGDAIVTRPGMPHKPSIPGPEPLVLLCCCSPAYSHEDTVLGGGLTRAPRPAAARHPRSRRSPCRPPSAQAQAQAAVADPRHWHRRAEPGDLRQPVLQGAGRQARPRPPPPGSRCATVGLRADSDTLHVRRPRRQRACPARLRPRPQPPSARCAAASPAGEGVPSRSSCATASVTRG